MRSSGFSGQKIAVHRPSSAYASAAGSESRRAISSASWLSAALGSRARWSRRAPAVLFFARRFLRLEHPEGELEEANRLLVGEEPRRPLACASRVVDRLADVAARGRLGEVVGELGQVRLGVPRVQPLERLADLA